MTQFLHRQDFPWPYQNVNPYPGSAIVLVLNEIGERRIAMAKDLWWGVERSNPEGVIVKARRLDRPRRATK